jgi:hypothetical protein
MSTLLFTLQVLGCGISILSASLSIVRFARGLRALTAPLEDLS